MLDLNTFLFIAVAVFLGVIALIVWVADSGISDKYKSFLAITVVTLTAGMGVLFFMIDDETEFEYAGYNKLSEAGQGGQQESMTESGGGGNQDQSTKRESGGIGDSDVEDNSEQMEEEEGGAENSLTIENGEAKANKDCDICPEMVAIKPGTALLGSTHLIASGGMKSGPAAQRDFHKTFHIGKYEITVEEFKAFVKAMKYTPEGKCRQSDGDKSGATYLDPGFHQTPKDPVVCVSWKDASRYALWLSAKTGKSYRLPTEAEWEFAARAGTTQTYMTGDTISTRVANFRPFTGKWKRATSPVGSFKPNANNMHDVHGNVWEFVNDCWSRYYQVAAAGGETPKVPIDCRRRIVKGGSWSSPLKQTGFPMRAAIPMDLALDGIGFRVMHE